MSDCDKVYVGDTGRKLGLRVDEHKSEADEAVTAICTRAQREASRSVVNKLLIDIAVDKN